MPRLALTCCVSGVRGAGVIEPRSGRSNSLIDRVGGDYRRFDMPPDPTGRSCLLACEAEEGCRAWTYLRPGYGQASAALLSQEPHHPPGARSC